MNDSQLYLYTFGIVRMLSAYHDRKVGSLNPIANFPFPVLVNGLPDRPILDAERRIWQIGLRYQIAPKVLVVVVVEADERAFGIPHRFLLSPSNFL